MKNGRIRINLSLSNSVLNIFGHFEVSKNSVGWVVSNNRNINDVEHFGWIKDINNSINSN